MFIDTHAHIYWDNLINRIDDVINDAKKAWVKKIICVWCNEKDAFAAKNLADKYDEVYFTAWIHPTDCKKSSDLTKIKEIVDVIKCLWIWECWFDLFHDKDSFEIQKSLFLSQISLATQCNKPLIIHTREAWELALDELQNYHWDFVVHCYTEWKDFASRLLDMWWIISIGWIITFPKSNELRDTIKSIPLDKIMLETDCPFLAPQSVRWKVNEPKHIPEIALCLSEIKWISINEVEETTTNTALSFFQIPD